MENIIIFGAGNHGGIIYKYIHENGLQEVYKVLAFCDNNPEKQGKTYFNIPVISPNEVGLREFDYIVIGIENGDPIKKQLLDTKICAASHILFEYSFICRMFSKLQYKKRYGSFYKSRNLIKNNSGKITVYTAITGRYDKLKEPAYSGNDIEYICFTNDKSLTSDVWNIRYVENNGLSNVMLARKIKILPELFMDIKGELLWVDAKYRIIGNLCEYRDSYRSQKGMLCFPHFERDNICDETATLIKLKKDIKKELILQAADYIREGFEDDNGLYETGCMWKDYTDSEVTTVMKKWWGQIEKYTYRDQISFPYVLATCDYEPDICDLFINENKYLHYEKHKS